MKDKLLLSLALINREEFSYRSLKVSISNYSKSNKVNFSLEYYLHIRFICISSLEYLGMGSNSNKWDYFIN